MKRRKVMINMKWQQKSHKSKKYTPFSFSYTLHRDKFYNCKSVDPFWFKEPHYTKRKRILIKKLNQRRTASEISVYHVTIHKIISSKPKVDHISLQRTIRKKLKLPEKKLMLPKVSEIKLPNCFLLKPIPKPIDLSHIEEK